MDSYLQLYKKNKIVRYATYAVVTVATIYAIGLLCRVIASSVQGYNELKLSLNQQ